MGDFSETGMPGISTTVGRPDSWHTGMARQPRVARKGGVPAVRVGVAEEQT